MDHLHIAVEILDKLRPRIWKKIVYSLMIIGIVYVQFYGFSLDSKAAVKEIMTGVFGLGALFVVWIDYYFSIRTYRKYQDTLISITELKAGK